VGISSLAPDLTCIAPVRTRRAHAGPGHRVRGGTPPADRDHEETTRSRLTRTCGSGESRPATSRTSGTVRPRTCTTTPTTGLPARAGRGGHQLRAREPGLPSTGTP
jgi:hypothetical protein